MIASIMDVSLIRACRITVVGNLNQREQGERGRGWFVPNPAYVPMLQYGGST